MRAEKQFLLDEIQDKIANAKAIVLASYKKLEPNAAAAFRSNLAKTGGSLEVVRKRILMKAAEAAGITLDKSVLQGHIAVFFADADPVQTTKSIFKFSSENEDVLKVLCGRFEGAICTAEDVEQISKLPSKDEMRAQLLSVFEAPMSQTLAVFEALLTSVIYCIDNKCEQSNS